MYDVFSLPEYKFPENFLWGSSTAGHQIEGDNIDSDQWKMEIDLKFEHLSGKACNSWELYRTDNMMLYEFGHKVYRMSIEWSRIEPREGNFNEKAIAHYVDLLEDLKQKKIKAFVTLSHFSIPQWFADIGGFTKRENLKYFERFINYSVPYIKDLVDGWNILNEFNFNMVDLVKKVNFTIAHARGYHIVKKYSKAPISSAHAFVNWVPYHVNDIIDVTMRDYVDYLYNEFFFHAIRTGEIIMPLTDMEYIPELKGSIDYWAINYYTRHFVDSRIKKMTGGKIFDHKLLKLLKSQFSLSEFYPEGMINNLERLKDKPVIITENGCACENDDFRIVSIALNLSALYESMQRGVDARGYIHWSLMDNYEWGSYTPTMGLFSVDRETFKRTPKKSAYFYKEIIENNGFNQDILRKYLKALPTVNK